MIIQMIARFIAFIIFLLYNPCEPKGLGSGLLQAYLIRCEIIRILVSLFRCHSYGFVSLFIPDCVYASRGADCYTTGVTRKQQNQ